MWEWCKYVYHNAIRISEWYVMIWGILKHTVDLLYYIYCSRYVKIAATNYRLYDSKDGELWGEYGKWLTLFTSLNHLRNTVLQSHSLSFKLYSVRIHLRGHRVLFELTSWKLNYSVVLIFGLLFANLIHIR